MSEKLKPIDVFADEFFEWDGGKKTPYVTLTSAKFFAEEWAKRAQPEDVTNAGDVSDTMRLDFLDECNRRLNASYGTNYHWKMVMNHNVNRLMLGSLKVDLNDAEANGLKSCRAAIDVEIKRTGYKPKPDGELPRAAAEALNTLEELATAEADLAKAREVIQGLVEAGGKVITAYDHPATKSGMEDMPMRRAITTARNWLEVK